MLLTCRQVSRALADKDYTKISSRNRFMVKMHVFLCGICGKYNKQIMSLQDGLRLYLQHEESDLSTNGVQGLNDEQREKLKSAVREAMSGQ